MSEIIKTAEIPSLLKNELLKDLGNSVYEIGEGANKIVLEVLKYDLAEKSLSIRHNHHTYNVIFKDDLDQVLDKMGIKRKTDSVSKNVKAPMPGKVLDVLVQEGSVVNKGDNILILEAMKMENVIKAETNCTIKKINISKLDNVEKNQVLIELEFSN